jgi:hypothetical protein
MSVNWSNELRGLDRVGPSRDLWADALARAAAHRPPDRRGFRRLSRTPSRRRGTLLLAAAALGIAGLAALGVLTFGSSSVPAAYAVTKNSDGTISITLRQFSALPALNRQLASEKLPLKAVPATVHCAFNPAPPLPRGFVPFVPSEQPQNRSLRPGDTITIDTSATPNGVVGVIGVGRNAGGLALLYAGRRAPGPSCINSAAFYQPEVRVTPLPVSRGKHVTIVAWVRDRPVRPCTISVYERWDKSGPSYVQGLSTKRPVRGRVSWTWQVAANTALDRRRVVVNCGSEGSLRTYISVTK